MKRRPLTSQTIVRLASLFALLALSLMVWGMSSADVVPVMVMMTVGQAIGTLSFVMYLWVIFQEARSKRLLARDDTGDHP